MSETEETANDQCCDVMNPRSGLLLHAMVAGGIYRAAPQWLVRVLPCCLAACACEEELTCRVSLYLQLERDSVSLPLANPPLSKDGMAIAR